MRLEGSCHCSAVRFSCDSPEPAPYMHCYCSICRKVAGGGGFAINLGGRKDSLTVEGEDNLSVYRVRRADGGLGTSRRHFCKTCGAMLWAWDESWPDLLHPFASAIDTPLPEAPERVHIMLESKASWVPVPQGKAERHFAEYPDESLVDWHRRHGLSEEEGT